MWQMRYVAYYVYLLFGSLLCCFSGKYIFLSSMANVMFFPHIQRDSLMKASFGYLLLLAQLQLLLGKMAVVSLGFFLLW